MNNIAIVPARSGSKGLKDKNIKLLKDKPLLAYSIEAAQQSGLFECVHVSTDSEKYAKIAEQYGADIPFLRTEELSGDMAGSWDVVRFVLREYEKRGQCFDTVTLLQPTSPLRNAEHIRAAYELYQKKGAKAVVSVCEMEHSPLWSNTLPENLSMEHFQRDEVVNTPRQALPAYYRLNGAIYIVDTDYLFETQNFYKKDCYAYIMSQRESVDIDGEMDFKLAEWLCMTSGNMV